MINAQVPFLYVIRRMYKMMLVLIKKHPHHHHQNHEISILIATNDNSKLFRRDNRKHSANAISDTVLCFQSPVDEHTATVRYLYNTVNFLP